jgi:hypothetical protein
MPEKVERTLNPTHTIVYGYSKESAARKTIVHGKAELMHITSMLLDRGFTYLEIQNHSI